MWTGGITVAFNPFLLPFDVISVGQNYEDETGRYRRLWRCIITSLAHEFGTDTLATGLGFNAALLLNRRIPDAPIVLKGVTSGNVAVPEVTYGNDEGGLWFNFTEVNWSGTDTEGWWIDPTLANGSAGSDTDGFWLDF
jgi:hypothetical protein